MKLAIATVCAALALSACSHTGETASLATPVTSLTEAEIRAQLVAVSRELDLVGSRTRETIELENTQRRMVRFVSGHSDSWVVGWVEQAPPGARTPPFVKIDRLLRRQDQLRAQLAKLTADELRGRS